MLAIIVIWGLNFVVMKIGLRSFTPLQLGAARYCFAALPLMLLVPRPAVRWGWLAAYGLLQGVGQFGLMFIALKVGMTAALASVLIQTQVFFTALFGFWLLRERVGRPLQFGLALAFGGLCCFAAQYAGSTGDGATTPLGFLLALGAAAMWAGSNIVARQVQAEGAYDALQFIVWASAVPVLPFVALSLAFDDPATRWQWTAAPVQAWLCVAYLGWMASIAGYSMWTRLLQRHAANRVAPFSLGVPMVGLAAGVLLLGESIGSWQWAGIALLVAALACVFLAPRWRR